MPASSSPRPLAPHPPSSRPHDQGQRDSPFSTSPTSISKPQPAHFHPSSTSLSRASPLVLDSLTRPTLPSSSISDSHASFVDLLRPDGSPYSPPRPGAAAPTQGSSSTGDSSSPTSSSARRASGSSRSGAPRVRGSSITSLHDLMDRAAADAPPRRRNSLPHGGPGPTPRSRRASDVARAEGGAAAQKEHDDGELSELSWGRWWPFAVVEPEAAKGVAAALQDAASAPLPPTPPAKDAHDASRGFLSLFAGKQAVTAAQAQADAQAEQDRLEAELLDASLDELSIAALRSAESLVLDADECPPASPPKQQQTIAQRRLLDKSLPPAPAAAAAVLSTSPSESFLPSLSSITGAANSASASIASTTSRMAGSTTSLLDSLTLPNPFNSSPASFFTSAAKSPTLKSPPTSPFAAPQQQHRHYSTKRHPGKDEGPTAKPSDVENLVDADDREAIKEEVEDNAETFSILKDKYRAPRLPLVFCHGLFGFDSIGLAGVKPLSFSYWIGVEEALVAMGAEVMIGRVPASASIEERAKVLCQHIGERFPGREVNLIGHSMGGLDGRFLISRLKPTNFKVRSLTTISTPHRGSSFADYLLEDILGAQRVPSFLGMMKVLGVPGGGEAFNDLTTTKMARFNEETPDDPDVKYVSYGAEFTPSWSNAFRIPWGIVSEREGPNDGLVSVESAKWGDYRATLHNVNHLDLIGWVGKVRYSFAAWSGHEIKFRPISMFCTIAEQLADEGL
ncbi:hypothetical protein JCM3775_003762 [Rhodotorula graminis]